MDPVASPTSDTFSRSVAFTLREAGGGAHQLRRPGPTEAARAAGNSGTSRASYSGPSNGLTRPLVGAAVGVTLTRSVTSPVQTVACASDGSEPELLGVGGEPLLSPSGVAAAWPLDPRPPAGVSECAQARRSGGAARELAAPSCPSRLCAHVPSVPPAAPRPRRCSRLPSPDTQNGTGRPHL